MTTMSAPTTPDVDPVVAEAQVRRKALMLSEASVDRHFDLFEDIDWDNPEFDPNYKPERWVLVTSADPIGRHPWYQALPLDKKIEIGKVRQANVAKVGLQFEAILIIGMMQHIFNLKNNGPGVPVLLARDDRRAQPHSDVPGDGEPRRRRAGHEPARASAAPPGRPGRCAVPELLLHGRARRRRADRPHPEGHPALG